MRLTDVTIQNLKAPEKGQKAYFDGAIPGFSVRVSQGGTKSFVLVAGRNRQRTTIGRYPVISLAQARAKAKEILAEKTLGLRSAIISPTYQSALADFLASRKHCRPRTLRDYQRLLNRHGFGLEKLDDISPRDIHGKLDRLAPSERLHAHDALQIFFRHAYRRHLIDRNPMERTERPEAGKSRERTLTDAELRAVWHACEGVFGQIVRLCILTGQRRSEIAQLQYQFVQPAEMVIILPAALSKNGRAHSFPYGDMTRAIIEETRDRLTVRRVAHNHETAGSTPVPATSYLFPARQWGQGKKAAVYASWGRDKAKLDQRSGVSGYVLHDLRRGFVSRWAALGIRLEVTEKYVNHISGSMAGVAGVYNRHSYAAEMREAVTLWEAHLQEIIHSTT